jgi:phytoene dehydrogenase-like protein
VSTPPASRHPDAVVIGAGHNGLVAANFLVDAGWDVVVLEANEHPGGAIWSDESVHPGYVSDLFSSFYPLGIASPVINALDLQTHGLTWRHAPAVLSHLLPDGRCAVLSRDLDETAASLDSFAPGDGAAWRQMYEEFDRIHEPLLGALFQPFPPVVAALRLLRKLRAAGALRFARFAIEPVRRFGEEQFDGEGGPLLLAGNALHTDLPPEGAASAMYGWLLAMLGQKFGFPVPEGGSRRIIDALVQRLTKAGGELRTSSPVERILVEHGTATGVRLASGETIRARRAVLADVSAPSLYRELVGTEHLPPKLVHDLDNFQWDANTLKVNWALSEKIPWANAQAGRAGTVHLGVDLDGMTRYAGALATRTIPEQPFLILGQMTTSDPTRSPSGTESAWCYTHLPEPGDALDQQAIRAHVHHVEDVIDKHAPGFRDLIAGRTVQAPRDLEEQDANLVGGAINGGTANPHQQLIFRPVPGLGRPETVVDRLYLAGSSAHPGGGVHGAPGHNAALAALSREAVTGPLKRRALRFAMDRVYR